MLALHCGYNGGSPIHLNGASVHERVCGFDAPSVSAFHEGASSFSAGHTNPHHLLLELFGFCKIFALLAMMFAQSKNDYDKPQG